MKVRPATSRDAFDLSRVHTAAWQWAYRGHMPDELLDNLDVDRRLQMWKSILDDDAEQHTFVAVDDGDIVGFVTTGPTAAEDVPAGTKELFSIYLLREVLHTGVGTALMDAALERWRKNRVPAGILWVLASNTKTHEFYVRHGWYADGATDEFGLGDYGARPVVRFRIDL